MTYCFWRSCSKSGPFGKVKSKVSFRSYSLGAMLEPDVIKDLHIFCNASGMAYGSVAYLQPEASHATVHISIMARSMVAPFKKTKQKPTPSSV